MGKTTRSILSFPQDAIEAKEGLPCPNCETPMELHQPDIQDPTRMLGICPSCHSWTLVRVDDDGRARLEVIPEP